MIRKTWANAHRHILLVGVAAAVLTVAVSDARAQGFDEDIIVTARKREESLQKVPVAISTLSGAQLAEQGIRTPLDLGRSVPSLRTTQHPSSASIVTFILRGQAASDVLSTIDQAVGLYVDGVYIARPRGLNAGFFDVARVEVLKGPQGTLYGRNTTGGAINIISKGADYDGVHGFVLGEGGNHSDWKAGGAVNVPLIADKLAVRLAYQRWSRDGFGKAALTGQDVGQDRNQHFFRGTLVADPADGVNIQIKGEWYRSRENGNIDILQSVNPAGPGVLEAAVELGALSPAGVLRFAAPTIFGAPTLADLAGFGAGLQNLNAQAALGAQDFRTAYYDHLQHDWVDAFTLGGTVTFDLADNVQLKSVTGLRRFTNQQVFDLDGTPFRILEVGVGHFPDVPIVLGQPGQPVAPFQTDPGPEQHATFFSQEFNVSGNAYDDRLKWLGGVYYSNENGSDTQHAQALPALVSNTFLHDGVEIQNTSWSVYSQNDFEIIPNLTLTFGGRYTEERKFLNSRSRNFFFTSTGGLDTGQNPPAGLFVPGNSISCLTGVPGAFPSSNPNVCFSHNEATFTGFSYLGSLNWQVTDNTLVYVKTAKGFRGGAFQLRAPLLAPAGPETARDIEIGLKSDWLDRRLRTNIAAYTTKYSNKQESIIIQLPNGASATVIQNAANANIKGFEAEVTATPFEGLTLSGTAAYISGKYKSFPGALPVSGLNIPVDASGERMSNPPWTYSVSGRYEFPLFMGALALQADWAWSAGARPPARLVNPVIPSAVIDRIVAICTGGSCSNGRDDLGLLNTRVDYKIEDYGVTISFFMTNVLDKKYLFSGIDPTAANAGLFTGTPGEPRMWGFQLRKSFGAGE